jgi:sugar lactone lactonase YvrE
MYYIDSTTRRVDAFDFHAGKISNRRCVIEIAEGFPDGMCSDRDGNLWIALWGGWGVVCHDPKTGERIAKIELPVEAVTSCCFDDRGGLFITTASRDLDAKGRELQPLAGGLFYAASVSVAQPIPSFG